MSWRTVVTSSRWASFGAKSTPGLPLFPDHEDPVELDDNLPSFVEAPRPDPDKSEARAAPGLPDLRDLGVRVDRVPVEDGAGKPDVLEPDLEAGPARPVDEQARRDRDRQEAVHGAQTEDRLRWSGANRCNRKPMSPERTSRPSIIVRRKATQYCDNFISSDAMPNRGVT